MCSFWIIKWSEKVLIVEFSLIKKYISQGLLTNIPPRVLYRKKEYCVTFNLDFKTFFMYFKTNVYILKHINDNIKDILEKNLQAQQIKEKQMHFSVFVD